MTDTLTCWHCGRTVDAIALPLGRSAQCNACGADLRVCRQCAFFDPAASKECREPMAEDVRDKERANFCDYFRPQPVPGAAQPAAKASNAHAKLDALFGGLGASTSSKGATEDAKAALDRLFEKKD